MFWNRFFWLWIWYELTRERHLFRRRVRLNICVGAFIESDDEIVAEDVCV
jgi:hypothetical protein